MQDLFLLKPAQIMTTRVRRYENSHSASDVHEVNTIALVNLEPSEDEPSRDNFLAALSFSITINYINYNLL